MRRKVWDNSDIKLPLVIKDSSWHFLHDFAHFKTCDGVFIFANAAHQVKYIGYTLEKCVVESIAEAISERKDEGTTLVKVLYTQNSKNALLISKVLKKKYNPENNNSSNQTDMPIITGTTNL